MPTSFLRRLAFTATALVTLVAPGVAAAPAWAVPYVKLSLASLAFESQRVDATGEFTVVPLTWTVRNTDQQAGDLFGTVILRQEGATPGSYVGQTYQLDYRIGERRDRSEFVSGTPQRSTYRYYFVVPRYAAGS